MKQSSLDAINAGVLPLILAASKGEAIPKSSVRSLAVDKDFISMGQAYGGDPKRSCTRPAGRKLLAEVIQECSKAMLV